MIHATWGDWFVREEVEAADPEGLSAWFLGCNGFALRTPETTLYLDPYFGDGEPPRLLRLAAVPMDPADATACDAVLVTHEHLDHMHPPSYDPLVDLGATLYAPRASFDEPDCDVDTSLHPDRYETVAVGSSFAVGDLTVHVRGANDPDAIEPVSYVIEHDAGTFFHGGDSRPAEAFGSIGTEFDIDLGALAFGSVGRRYDPDVDETRAYHVYMDENDVVEAANALEIDRLLPTHCRMWKDLEADPTALHEHARSFAYPRSIHPIDVGDRVDVGRSGIVPLGVLG